MSIIGAVAALQAALGAKAKEPRHPSRPAHSCYTKSAAPVTAAERGEAATAQPKLKTARSKPSHMSGTTTHLQGELKETVLSSVQLDSLAVTKPNNVSKTTNMRRQDEDDFISVTISI